MADAAATLIRQYYNRFNAGDWDGMIGLMAEDVAHDINQGGREIGRDAFRRFLERMARSYREQVGELVVMTEPKGRHVGVEYVVSGAYVATDTGLPPARGQTYRLPGGAFFDLAKGRIARIANYYNLQEWLRQIA
ncbi:MAG: nuclear transport factor 2 family protein [Proteobacteria bacterium]|nr:nuclear transport factor 2 family protein [Pseudomonadota bacterium]MBI3496157.1 nuclear transport factor 2 family protein [Pseudomonadota bacterium]